VGVMGRGLVYDEGGDEALRADVRVGAGVGAGMGVGVGEDGGWRAVGIAFGGDGDASGVNSPLYTLSRPFVAPLPSQRESSEPDDGTCIWLETLSSRQEVDADGEGVGEADGERRGGGRGNSWSSSSSSILDVADDEDDIRSWPCPCLGVDKSLCGHTRHALSISVPSIDRHRLSISSTVIASPKPTPRLSPLWKDELKELESSEANLRWSVFEGDGSRLLARLRRAPRKNFSCQASPDLRHSSVMG
jgi:hypothetical protein